MRLCELAQACYCYSVVASRYDKAYAKLRETTRPGMAMQEGDWRAVLVWLSEWGCRHIPADKGKDTTNRDAESLALKGWAKVYLRELPSCDSTLLECHASNRMSEVAGRLYESLEKLDLNVTNRRGKPVKLGPTAAAKVLFALRPRLFAPWDRAIRSKRETASDYVVYLREVAKDLVTLKHDACKKVSSMEIDDLPYRLGRPGSTLVKLADEYYWCVHRGWKPLSAARLVDWQNWCVT